MRQIEKEKEEKLDFDIPEDLDPTPKAKDPSPKAPSVKEEIDEEYSEPKEEISEKASSKHINNQVSKSDPKSSDGGYDEDFADNRNDNGSDDDQNKEGENDYEQDANSQNPSEENQEPEEEEKEEERPVSSGDEGRDKSKRKKHLEFDKLKPKSLRILYDMTAYIGDAEPDDLFYDCIYEQLIKSKHKENMVELIQAEDFFNILQNHKLIKKYKEPAKLKLLDEVKENLKELLCLDPQYKDLFMMKKINK